MTDHRFAERRKMIDQQLRSRGLRDDRVLAAMLSVPRHLFVPLGLRHEAYRDTPLPIGWGQTISQPYIVALMTSALSLHGNERVLEVGTGSGYQAAVLAGLSGEVHSVEIIPQLLASARRVLERLKLHNVVLHAGDGSFGWRAAAPFDAVLVTAAAPALPRQLFGQLTGNGRIVVPIVASSDYQVLTLVEAHGELVTERPLTPVAFVPLRGKYGVQS